MSLFSGLTTKTDYELKRLIFKNQNSEIYLAFDQINARQVILKKSLAQTRSAPKTNPVAHEHDVLKNLNHSGIPKAYELASDGKSLALVKEFVEGQNLKERLFKKELSVSEVLKIAVQLTEILEYVHDQELIHRDINPENILITQMDSVKLIDFAIATSVGTGEGAAKIQGQMEGSLCYISPEQTGRTTFSLTRASDFYSFGIVLYEMLAGKPPFDSADPLEIIHFHLSRNPISLNAIVKNLPEGLHKIVTKLLQKDPADRYRTAQGLLADLKRVFHHFESSTPLVEFKAGREDNAGQYQKVSKLYGRDADISRLLQYYEELDQLKSILVLVSGYSGVGKSAIITHIKPLVVDDNGVFLSGKFDQFKKDIPYYAFIEAIQEFIKNLLSQPEEIITQWRKRILSVLGDNAALIVEVIPLLSKIIPATDTVIKLQPAEQESRFNKVLLDFVYVFASAENPLVLFLDDLQWADLSSLNLVKRILQAPRNKNVFILSAYRDNEVGKGHPLMITVGQIDETQKIKKLHLEPLDLETTCKITEGSLGMSVKNAEKLGAMVFGKTKGNPFFTHNFLKSLYDKKLVRTDQKGKWIWNAGDIDALGYTENVVDLMTEGLTDLPKPTQNLLKNAAVLGNTFYLKDLVSIVSATPNEVFKELLPAVREGYLTTATTNPNIPESASDDPALYHDVSASYESLVFSFGHDKIQQAAYGLIDEDENAFMHLKIARLLVENWSELQLQENVFELLNLYAQGLHLLEDKPEKLKIAGYCLAAGRKAKDSISYSLGVRVLDMGKNLLPKDSWSSHYGLTYNITIELGECEYLSDNPKKAESHFKNLLNRAKTRFEKLQVYYLHASLYLKIGNTSKSLQLGMDAMRLYNMRFPKKKSAIQFAAMRKVAKYLFLFSTKYRDTELILSRKDCTDEEIIALNRFLIDLSTSAYQQDKNLMMLVVLKIIEFHIKYGFTNSSAFGFAGFSVTALSALKLQKLGFKLWELTLRLNKKTSSALMRARLDYTVVCFYNPWRKPFAAGYDEILENIKSCVSIGDPIWTGYTVSLYFRIRIMAGENLADVLITSRDQWHLLSTGSVGFDFILGLHRLAVMLSDRPSDWEDLDKSSDTFERLRNEGNKTKLGFYNAAEIARYYFTGNFKKAISICTQYTENMLGDATQAWIAFFHAMSIAAVYGQMEERERRANLNVFKTHFRDFKRWAKGCPENFEPYLHLLSAEYLGMHQKWQDAFPCYERAIESAATSKIRYVEAIAKERVAASCQKMGYGQLRSHFIKETWAAYQRWGAMLKCRELEAHHPALLADKINDGVSKTSSGMAFSNTAALDLASLIKASQSIASQVKYKDLLKTLMHIIIENAGAEKGYFLLYKNEKLHLEAKALTGEKKVKLLNSLPLDVVDEIPKSFINYCWRTQETVILDDALADKQFGNDSYVKNQRVLSMMCLPISALGKVNGLLYLENTVLKGVFDSDRATLLQMLSGQIGISVENALLYENLEGKVLERTREIEKTLTELKATQSQLIQSEKMASLGELTAGIAHEIQNPLNFVNNFSEVNVELIDEMQEEIKKGDFEEAVAISEDIKSNQLKIQHHGERADSIVKGMLQHSRSSKGVKETTNINALCDEYLRLAYHGLRAKDKSFNATLETQFEENLPQIEVVPQDVGRVILNLITNAFHACADKKVKIPEGAVSAENYQPLVKVSTKDTGQDISIAISDNADGIPAEVKEKIFQPFFTTKPSGRGTGLGLSLSYDIVHAHGGKIDLETKIGSGTTFTIRLPK
ncbi:MAG: AAA family ATPase [Leeuwenhoekiella sp.]